MRTYITHNFCILLKGTLAFNSSMAALFSASVKGFTPETGFLNGECGRKPQVNLRSRARCSNSIGWGVQPDQWRALDLSLT